MYNVSYTRVAKGHLWHCAPSRRRQLHEFIIARWCLRTWNFHVATAIHISRATDVYLGHTGECLA